MPAIYLNGKGIIEKFIAGEPIIKGDVVYISGSNEVKKATSTEARRVIGVANKDASPGDEIEVVIYGKAEVVADGAISAGDSVIAAPTAGRVVSENTKDYTTSGHSHTENLATTYTQNATTASATDTVSVEHSRVLGIALGAASTGEKLLILVCLRG